MRVSFIELADSLGSEIRQKKEASSISQRLKFKDFPFF